ncbi:hypothetical protein Ddye_014969 [Dipteronia dyeriana]|uniref:RPA-interacting protein n=1 Tax=Dipteronia dyeriana TaxID=168575 RepID=A0AAD9U3W9_9ROSI|nr:hypothetical protein Ddye_014969 [Dipteronia dyeriana]
MEDDKPVAAQKQPSLKPNLRFNNHPNWKAKLRENCYKRVREDRNRLLWKMRMPTAQSLTNKYLIKSAFQDIVSDELKKIKNLSSDDSLNTSSPAPAPAPEADDMLWEYDGLRSAYQGDCEEILLQMQMIFYEDLLAEPARKESDIEIWEDQEDEYLARAVYENMQLNDQVCKETWCPICKQGELLENHQRIYCNRCELKLSKDDEVHCSYIYILLWDSYIPVEHFLQQRIIYALTENGVNRKREGTIGSADDELLINNCKTYSSDSFPFHCLTLQVNLDKLRIRLADAHAEHLDRGCRLRPKFCIQTRFGLTALYISCQDCNTFEVVM